MTGGRTEVGRGAPTATPRVGFLGAGWIGRHRMSGLAATGLVEAVAVADPDATARELAAEAVPGIETVDDLDALLHADLDGIVIATPSALHAEQATAALERGISVFCQKPLARDVAETRRVVDVARSHDALLAVDLSYRHLAAAAAAREAIAAGALGEIYSCELVFHNAYGPDKPWFTNRRLSGGGCLIDLGTHLVDLGLWLAGERTAAVQAARVLRDGRPLSRGGDAVEDFAIAQLLTERGVSVRVACSWFLPAGAECVIECTLYGTDGAVSIRNVDGSFYDFVAERHTGTRSERLVEPPDDWGPRAITAWAEALRRADRFDPEAERLIDVAAVLDAIYEVAA